eukprot:773038-Prorocentrum_minimum.AAC.2
MHFTIGRLPSNTMLMRKIVSVSLRSLSSAVMGRMPTFTESLMSGSPFHSSPISNATVSVSLAVFTLDTFAGWSTSISKFNVGGMSPNVNSCTCRLSGR